MTLQVNKIKFWLLGLLFFPMIDSAQDLSSQQTGSLFSNTLFLSLLTLIIVLLVVVVVLAQALKNISGSDLIVDKFKKVINEVNADSVKKVTTVLFVFLALSSQASNGSTYGSWKVGGLDMLTFYSLLFVVLLEVGLIFFMCATIVRVIKTEKAKAVEVKTRTIFQKLNAAVDIEKEHDILLDHDYDGIKELDNDLPPWWKYGFYLTILIAIIYLINFHIAGTGDLQDVEYQKSVAKAKIEVEEYMKTAANNVDETTVKQLSGADLETGKEIFISTCSACHGKFGQGTVGPNLTDDYWLHSGSLVDVFKSIKYGWVDKGMKSWKEDLSPMQIAQIASFIMTLKGTNPEGAKAAQGDLYKEEKGIAKDSTVVIADSLIVKPDTLK